jgi:hypothetical protein
MAGITLVDNINALNVAILPILNGIVPFTHVKPVSKQHRDMRQGHVMDISLMMGFEAITM